MKLMRLAHQADRRGARVHHRRQHIVILGRPARALGHAEGGEGGAGRRVRRQRTRCRSGSRPASRPRCNRRPSASSASGDLVLFGGRELHALRLLPVAQGGVEEVEAFAGHVMASSLPASKSGPGAPRGLRRAASMTTTPAPSRMARSRSASAKSLAARAARRAAISASIRAADLGAIPRHLLAHPVPQFIGQQPHHPRRGQEHPRLEMAVLAPRSRQLRGHRMQAGDGQRRVQIIGQGGRPRLRTHPAADIGPRDPPAPFAQAWPRPRRACARSSPSACCNGSQSMTKRITSPGTP